eukprot:CAMPEP_0179255052 /NCGR_PEP_ID=MMETSP0797-20121207/23550_1 /TAXON_ID=47934 /ORGANISM="Dinophysis acuminata, Strain DAEP01" /LENGTH=43 /DNA_ID= /DNA_START= /DNA_END= /DNA_ORIENTATION=
MAARRSTSAPAGADQPSVAPPPSSRIETSPKCQHQLETREDGR